MPDTPSPQPDDAAQQDPETPTSYPQPSYYAYGAPGSPSQAGENGVPVMYPPPPGGYWPPGYMAIPVPMHMGGAGGPINPNGKPKRKQVKNACTNCQTACKRCDDSRPCARCVKYGLSDTCINSARKERKKGIKRGPYKKRKEDEGQMDMDDPNVAMDAMMPQAGAPYHGALPPGYPEGGYYSYFPGYAFSGGPGHLVPAHPGGEDGEEEGDERSSAAAAAAAHAYYAHMYPYYQPPPQPEDEDQEGHEHDGQKDDDEATHEEEAPAPVAPPPAKKGGRKKASAGAGGEDKPKAARGRKKKAAAAAPPPPPPVQQEEDELEQEQDDDEW
ncbi:hypothetical protein EXIGLDRAFT_728977 [Exidia glandulosa HHB12029]|uniref:Zn(2)-C6 fungal-type domain-containing protein n=1 Tax=Exidia glandulosa HHB12029 TaxID=1314781 RepID=A0A165LPX8_EXIGL|nr:hypothetical protein EXIGLDRAFT_728977 [Exidia glandulosa HHB12029]